MVVLRDRAVVVVEHLPESNRISVSIIIPILNESSQLGQTLEKLFQGFNGDPGIEVIIGDGGSDDDSLEIAKHYPCRIIIGKTGRARQMNAASQAAKGDWLLFLHADSLLPEDWRRQLQQSEKWGFFPVKFNDGHWLLRVIERTMNLRSRLSEVATGDQALYFRKSFFDQLGGFPDIPIMEDIAITKRARRKSKPRVANCRVMTSSRRWQQNGLVNTVVLMWGLRLAYFLGVDPERLHRFYYPKHHSQGG
jgi:rSAM/selenodomain-associated transferase 2